MATEGGDPVAFLLAYLLDRIDGPRPMACLYEITVSPSRRRQGIGRALIAELRTVCDERGVGKLWAVLDRHNDAALALYRSTGAEIDITANALIAVYHPREAQS